MSLRRRTVEALVAAGLLGTALAPPAAAAGEGQGRAVPLRVATYNIHAGAGMDNVFDLDRQTAELRSLDGDVIGLQEVDVHWGTRSEWRNLASELAQRLDMRVSFAPVYSLDPETPGAPRREFGVRGSSPAERPAASSALPWAAVIGCPASSAPGPGVVVSTTTRDEVTAPSATTAPKAPTGSPRASTKASGSRLCGTPPPGIVPPPGGFAARTAMASSWSSSLPYM